MSLNRDELRQLDKEPRIDRVQYLLRDMDEVYLSQSTFVNNTQRNQGWLNRKIFCTLKSQNTALVIMNDHVGSSIGDHARDHHG